MIQDGDSRLAAFVSGPSDQRGPRQKLRVEVPAPHAEFGQAFLAELTAAMSRLNVYCGLPSLRSQSGAVSMVTRRCSRHAPVAPAEAVRHARSSISSSRLRRL